MEKHSVDRENDSTYHINTIVNQLHDGIITQSSRHCTQIQYATNNFTFADVAQVQVLAYCTQSTHIQPKNQFVGKPNNEAKNNFNKKYKTALHIYSTFLFSFFFLQHY